MDEPRSDPDAAGGPWVRPTRVKCECVYCENTAAEFSVLPGDGKTVQVRCEGCGAVVEITND